jgi:hypothetical protein
MKMMIVCVLFALGNLFALSGTIDATNNNWGTGGNVASPVTVEADITVNPGITLTIAPGCQVNFHKSARISLSEKSGLVAHGEYDNFIKLSYYTDVGIVDYWYGIVLADSSSISLKFVHISGVHDGIDADGAIVPDVSLENCILESEGYGFKLRAPTARINIKNCTIYTRLNGIIFSGFHAPSITNNIMHSYITISCLTSGSIDSVTYNLLFGAGPEQCRGEGLNNIEVSISTDLKFVDLARGDFHLQPASPGVDAGDPASDYSLEPQGGGGRINMGAYGNTPEAAVKVENAIKTVNRHQNISGAFSYPNPFNHCTIFNIPQSADNIQIMGIDGNVVRILNTTDGFISWDGRDNSGKLLPTGVYFYQFKAGDSHIRHKILLSR